MAGARGPNGKPKAWVLPRRPDIMKDEDPAGNGPEITAKVLADHSVRQQAGKRKPRRKLGHPAGRAAPAYLSDYGHNCW